MKFGEMTRFTAVLIGLFVLRTAAEVRIQPAPSGEVLSTNFTVSIANASVPVYVAKVASGDRVLRFKAVDDVPNSGNYFEKASFASFDLQGEAEVVISCPEPVKTAKVLPSRLGVAPAISGNRVSFKVSGPALLTVEINGDWVHSLHIFANPRETNVPRPDATNVIYFAPGIHEVDQLRVKSGQTVYVADGAVVRGKPGNRGPIVSVEGRDITLRGRGIIDGSLCPIHTRNLLYINGTNVTVDGIILRDSSTWTVPVRRSQNVKFSNVKLFGHRANSDGIDICNSRDVEVTNCFLRTLDDLIVVKTDKGQGPAENILARNCVLWNEIAHALSIGAELREPVNNVRFSDCDVIHDKGREWTLRVFHCDSALISNVVFENIRIEETRNLISLWIGSFVWTRDPERGHIRGVVFKDITAAGDHPLIELKGFDAQHLVEDVTFRNVSVNGQLVRTNDIKLNEFVRGVVVQ